MPSSGLIGHYMQVGPIQYADKIPIHIKAFFFEGFKDNLWFLFWHWNLHFEKSKHEVLPLIPRRILSSSHHMSWPRCHTKVAKPQEHRKMLSWALNSLFRNTIHIYVEQQGCCSLLNLLCDAPQGEVNKSLPLTYLVNIRSIFQMCQYANM